MSSVLARTFLEGSARCRVKVALRHTYVVLRMHRVVRHIHDICAIHIRRNSVHGHLKLLMVKWLGFRVRVRLGTGNGYFIPFFLLLKSNEHLSLAFLALSNDVR